MLANNRKHDEPKETQQDVFQYLSSRYSFFQFTADGERESRSHGKQEERKNQIYPCNAIERLIKKKVGTRPFLRMIHPSRQHTKHNTAR